MRDSIDSNRANESVNVDDVRETPMGTLVPPRPRLYGAASYGALSYFERTLINQLLPTSNYACPWTRKFYSGA